MKTKVNDLKQLIDEYGKLKETINELEKNLERVQDELKEVLEVGKEYTGTQYKVTKSERITPVISPELTYKKLKDKIVNVVSVNKTALQKILSEQEIDKLISDYKKSIVLNVKKL